MKPIPAGWIAADILVGLAVLCFLGNIGLFALEGWQVWVALAAGAFGIILIATGVDQLIRRAGASFSERNGSSSGG